MILADEPSGNPRRHRHGQEPPHFLLNFESVMLHVLALCNLLKLAHWHHAGIFTTVAVAVFWPELIRPEHIFFKPLNPCPKAPSLRSSAFDWRGRGRNAIQSFRFCPVTHFRLGYFPAQLAGLVGILEMNHYPVSQFFLRLANVIV